MPTFHGLRIFIATSLLPTFNVCPYFSYEFILCNALETGSSYTYDRKKYEVSICTYLPICLKIFYFFLSFFLQHLVLPCNKTIIAFFWINDFIAYGCQYFQPIVMEAGLCYSHNLIPISQLFTSEYLKVWE